MQYSTPDRVKQTSSTTGTSDFTLSGSIAGFNPFSVLSAGALLPYVIVAVDIGGNPTGEWESGFGSYPSANTLARNTVLASSNAGALVNFSAGTKHVSIGFNGMMAGWIREKLSADRTYYVRTDGSDSNTGLTNTSVGAFLTIQKAIDVVCGTLDTAIYTVTIQVADGTYTGANALKYFSGGGSVIIQGNTGAMSNVIINPTSETCFTNTSGRAGWELHYMKLTTTTSGNGIYCGRGSIMKFSNLDFGACPGSHQVMAEQGGKVQSQGNSTISGNAYSHFSATGTGSEIRETGSYTCTLTGTPAFTHFALASNLAFIYSSSVTYSGSATGQRYSAALNAVINTNGGGANYFPGNTTSAPVTGGQYA